MRCPARRAARRGRRRRDPGVAAVAARNAAAHRPHGHRRRGAFSTRIRGLGSSYQYLGRGLSLTIYVYDAGVEAIPDGADNIPVCDQFEDAKNGVTKAGYRDMALKSEQMVRLAPPGDVLLAREAVFEFVRQERKTISYVWVTAAAKNFIKLRFSLDAELRDEVPEARRALLDALGEAVQAAYSAGRSASRQSPVRPWLSIWVRAATTTRPRSSPTCCCSRP